MSCYTHKMAIVSRPYTVWRHFALSIVVDVWRLRRRTVAMTRQPAVWRRATAHRRPETLRAVRSRRWYSCARTLDTSSSRARRKWKWRRRHLVRRRARWLGVPWRSWSSCRTSVPGACRLPPCWERRIVSPRTSLSSRRPSRRHRKQVLVAVENSTRFGTEILETCFMRHWH